MKRTLLLDLASAALVTATAPLLAGDVERAFDIYDAYLPMAKYEQQAGPGLAVRKYILARRGVIASEAVRKPGPKLSAPDIADIERLIARQEKKLLALR